MVNPGGQEQTGLWLEAELARQLCPVVAPDALWNRIHEQRRPLRVRRSPAMAWSISALALVLLVGLVWRLGGATGDPNAQLERLAARELRELASGSGTVDIHSGDPEVIQAWVNGNLGVEVRLDDRLLHGNSVVRLLGAGLVRLDKSPVAVVAYRVGDDYAALLVEARRPGTGGAQPRAGVAAEAKVYSWSAGSGEYAMALGGRAQQGQSCLLCHTESTAMLLIP